MYEDPRNKEHAKTMIDFMKWALTEGQRYAVPLGYAPLPPDVIQMELQALQTVKTT
jgi:phosphate transport system substrate-binding protein